MKSTLNQVPKHACLCTHDSKQSTGAPNDRNLDVGLSHLETL